MKVTAGLNSCLKQDRAWTKCSARDALRCPSRCSAGASPAAKDRVVRGELGSDLCHVPAAGGADALPALLMGGINSLCLPVKWGSGVSLACCR